MTVRLNGRTKIGENQMPFYRIAARATSLSRTDFTYLLSDSLRKRSDDASLLRLYDPNITNTEQVGFDNKTNYIHERGSGLEERLARGLTVFLNSSVVDEFFRLFSGHTQVNAADLRRMQFPSIQQLRELSQQCEIHADQETIDAAISKLF